MTKAKYLIITFLLVGILFFIPNISNAAVEYTRTITGNDGSITLNLTGLELDETKQYSFSLVTKGATPITWHTITNYTTSTAEVSLTSSTADILDVLKVTDTGVLYIKDDSDDSYIVDGLQVNLKLPYMNAVNAVKETSKITVNKIYGYKGTSYYKWQKITDRASVEKYLEYKNNGSELVETDFAQVAPTTGFSSDWAP